MCDIKHLSFRQNQRMDGKIYDVYYYFFANIVVLGKFEGGGGRERGCLCRGRTLQIENIVFDSNLTFG